MRIDILTLFPEAFQGAFDHSILKRAREKNLVAINLINIRDYSSYPHKQVDDTPFGGGAGMVLKVDVIQKALESVRTQDSFVVLLSSSGKKYSQEIASNLFQKHHLVLICGHYEGVDERIINYLDLELSIGDYVLSGGEIPAMVVTDSIVRLLPNVLGEKESLREESFSDYIIQDKSIKLVEYPQYTRPQEYKSLKVPEVLFSGNHEEIKKWRLQAAFEKTKKNRPDLLK